MGGSDGAGEPDPDFGALFERRHRQALRLAFLLAGDRTVAEDLVSEAFLAMYPAWARGQGDDPWAYLRRCLVNGTRARWRRSLIVRRLPSARPLRLPPVVLVESGRTYGLPQHA